MFTALEHFYLAIGSDDDTPPFELDTYGFEGEWTEEQDLNYDQLLRELDEDEDDPLDYDDMMELQRRERVRAGQEPESSGILDLIYYMPPVEKDENGEMTKNGKADNFLRGFEERAFQEMEGDTSHFSSGAVRLDPVPLLSKLADNVSLYKSEVEAVFDTETNSDWKPLAIHIRQLITG